jgi:hypothetical protein
MTSARSLPLVSLRRFMATATTATTAISGGNPPGPGRRVPGGKSLDTRFPVMAPATAS